MQEAGFGLVLVGLLFSSVSARFISDNICLAMPNGQKLPVTNDCSSYIVCEYNVQTIQHCTVGTLFDPITKVCNWAFFVKCGQTPSLPPIQVAPSPAPTIPTAPTPNLTNPTSLSTAAVNPSVPTAPTAPPTPAKETPSIEPSTPSYIPTAPTASPTTRAPAVVNTFPTAPTNRPTTTVRPPATTLPTYNVSNKNPYPFCTPDEFSFIAHPSACESYYICAYGKLILHSCGHGVYWNTATNQCDFPDNTDCTNLPNPAAPETSTPSAETTTISSTPDCYGSEIFYPNYNDCKQYYICIGLHPILMSCPADSIWNSKTSQCDQPTNAVCAQK